MREGKLPKEQFLQILAETKEGTEYLGIVQEASNRPLKRRRGFEKHHVFPRGFGGTDADGLVSLTTFEHIKAHYLLAIALDHRVTYKAMRILLGSQFTKLSDLEKIQVEDLQNIASVREKALSLGCGKVGGAKISKKAKERWQSFRDTGRIEEIRKNISEQTKIGMQKPEVIQKLRCNLGSKWYYNPKLDTEMHWYPGMDEPTGDWVPGRRPMSKEAKEKLSASQKGLLTFYHNDELRINKKFPIGTEKEGWVLGKCMEYAGNRRNYEIEQRSKKYELLGAPDSDIKKSNYRNRNQKIVKHDREDS